MFGVRLDENCGILRVSSDLNYSQLNNLLIEMINDNLD